MEIILTTEDVKALVAARIAEVLSPERLDAIAVAQIERRIGTLTIEEARVRLRFKTARQLKDWCRAHKVPRVKQGREWLIKIGEIEKAQEENSHMIPDTKCPDGIRCI